MLRGHITDSDITALIDRPSVPRLTSLWANSQGIDFAAFIEFILPFTDT